MNDEAPRSIPDKLDEFLVPGTDYHHMVTGKTAQASQIPEFPTAQILTQLDTPSHKYQTLSTQASQNNNLPLVQHTQKHQNSVSINSISCLSEANAGFTSQQLPQATMILKPVSTNTLVFDGKK